MTRVAAALPRGRWALVRLLAAAAILAALGSRLGAAPFLDGIRKVDGAAVGAAIALTAATTACCAWRWNLVASSLGVRLPVRTAARLCYRSQFLNTTLPFGVVGDVERAVAQGRRAGDVGLGLRIVGLERSAGQVVQVVVAAVVLLLLPSPVHAARWVFLAVAGASGLAVLCFRTSGRATWRARPWARTARTVLSDVRRIGALRTWPGVLVASFVVVVGHTATFLVAARAVGSTAPTISLLPIALIVLLAMSLPLSVAGWGPREGAAAWAFAAAGLGASEGIAVAVVYGVLVLVACLPGAAFLMVDWLRDAGRPRETVLRGETVGELARGAAHA